MPGTPLSPTGLAPLLFRAWLLAAPGLVRPGAFVLSPEALSGMWDRAPSWFCFREKLSFTLLP